MQIQYKFMRKSCCIQKLLVCVIEENTAWKVIKFVRINKIFIDFGNKI